MTCKFEIVFVFFINHKQNKQSFEETRQNNGSHDTREGSGLRD